MSHARNVIRLFLILLIVQSALCRWKPNVQKKESVCKNKACVATGKEYKHNMDDDNAHPCEDFYSFACGNFHKNHPKPKYTSEYNVINLMNAEMVSIIRKTLESYTIPPNENSLFRQAKEVYETCLKIPEFPMKEAKDVAREVMKVGRVPSTPLWDIHLKYLQLSGESAFFRTKILGNRPSEGIPVLMLMEPTSAYGSIFHEVAWKPQEKDAYTNFLFLIIKSLSLTGSDELIKKRIQKVFDFRRNLDLIIDRNSRQGPDIFYPLTGRELDVWFLNAVGTQTKTQDVPWPEVIDVLLQNLPWQMRKTRRIVAIRRSQYFIDLMNLIKDVPEEVLAFHAEIYFIERHLKLKDNLVKLLQSTSVEPHKMFSYIRENKFYPRWQTCIENHNMQDTLETMLFGDGFLREHLGDIQELLIKIKTAIDNQMKASTWLNEATRKHTMRKLNELEEWIGYPSWFTNANAHRRERKKKDILTPNASLNIKYKLLYVHLPILLPPIFAPTLPAVYNYAGIGATLGHELYHVLDNCGCIFENGERNCWWAPEMREECLKKERLFINTYNNITNRDFQKRYDVKVDSDTSISFSENFPDVMGLEAAYNAYKELPSTDKLVCEVVPGFKDYSCDQMFYITFANTFCGRYTKKSVLDKLYKSEHSIDSVRINGAVAQMESFGTTFGCPLGSPMNPKEKVNLWK